MTYTHSQIQQIATLHKRHYELTNEIIYIKKLMHQLLNHECEITFTLDIHNLAQHEQNAGAEKAEQLVTFGGIGEFFFFGIPKPASTDKKPCHERLIFDCSEATAITMLAALLREKEENRNKTLKEFNELMAVDDNTILNPITELHK